MFNFGFKLQFVMGKIEFEGRQYDFKWSGLLILAVGGPLLSLLIYFSNDYIWLHEITANITIWSLNLITGIQNEVQYSSWGNYWYINMKNVNAPGFLPRIQFTTFCTGIQAIAIFIGVIFFIPHPTIDATRKDIWPRKIKAMIVCSALFYFVNIIRMWIQLYLYQIGYAWDDVHYPISAASSFIAIAAILVMHKYVPEFIMSLIWISDQVRNKLKKPIGQTSTSTANIAESSVSENSEMKMESVVVQNPSNELPK